MSDHTEWRIERDEPGWFGRLVSPERGGKPATAAFLIAVLGAGAFVASMVLDWVTVTLPQNFGQDGVSLNGQSFGQSLVNTAMLGQVYALVGIGLMAYVGSVLTRPDAALRVRMGVTGLGVGMLSIVVAGTINLRSQALDQWTGLFGGPSMEGAVTALEAGIFTAYAASVLPVVAVWLAARPAARAARPRPGGVEQVGAATTDDDRTARQAAPESPQVVDAPAPYRSTGRGGGVGGPSVSASEPLDLSVSPDPWRG
jgi:hypothetical protein